MHEKTTLKCKKCGEYIYTDEGFTTVGIDHFHARSCVVILKPKDCKRYHKPKEDKPEFTLPSIEKF